MITVANGQAAPFDASGHLPVPGFLEAVADAVDGGARLVAYFSMPNPHPTTLFDDAVIRIAVLGRDERSRLEIVTSLSAIDSPGLSTRVSAAARFEREMALAATASAPEHQHVFQHLTDPAEHEVAVGPVHAGVIEPGHFRFRCIGETVLSLEILLGYQHRGFEHAMIELPEARQLALVQELAGDTTVGHTLAYCQLIEGLSNTRAAPRAHVIRAVALELERMANHTGDIGALASDISYQPTAAVCGRLRGALLNLTAEVCGNRFGRWLLTPGGVLADIPPETADLILTRLATVAEQVERAADRFLDTPGVLHRLEGTAAIEPDAAIRLGMVGVAARACGVARDVRHDYPHGYYTLHQIPMAVAGDGDVYSRALVRRIETMRAGAFVREALTQLPEGDIRRTCSPLRGGMIAVSLVEAWRGEVAHVAITNVEGRIVRYKVVDPSFHNWNGLEVAMSGEQISDFPLSNKSFNLSYAGHDL